MINLIKFVLLIFVMPAFATLNDVDKAFIFNKNILLNPGFENGGYNWAVSGGGTTSLQSSGSNLLLGKNTMGWGASSSTQYYTSTAVTIPKGMYGRNGVASCLIKTAASVVASDYSLTVYDGSSTLVSASIPKNDDIGVRTSANFVFPSSGSLSIRFSRPSGTTDGLYIDDCYLGPAEGYNIANVSQAQFYGEVVWPGVTNCSWTVTASATPTAFGADSDCTLPTGSNVRGNASDMSGSSKVPSILLNNMPPGNYEVIVTGFPYDASTTIGCGFYLYDGTTTEYAGSIFSGGSNFAASPVIRGRFRYTSTASRTIQVYATGITGSASCNIYNGTASIHELKITVYKYPIESDIAYTPDKTANSWSGYHDSTCSWARTNTALGDPTADASCALTTNYNTNFGTVTSVDSGGSALPGITFTPSRAGKYYACASFFVIAGSSGQASAQLLAGSDVVAVTASTNPSTSAANFNLCGIVNASTTSSINLKIQTAAQAGSTTLQSNSPATHAIDWTIFQIDQALPMPNIVNSVVNPRSGVTNICSGYISNSGTTTVNRSDGNCLSINTDHGAGDTSLNIAAGTFSDTPNCVCQAYGTVGINCIINTATAISSTLVRTLTFVTNTNTASDRNFFIICVGPK